MEPQNIMILGGGGREHALAWKISQSPLCQKLIIAPGNAGTAQLGTNEPVSVMDFPAVKALVLKHHIDLLVVGPDAPLGAGIVDFLQKQKDLLALKIVGPRKYAAQMESSKGFAKAFMQKYGIPTAAYQSFGTADWAALEQHLHSSTMPIVVKANGLAEGKGVQVCNNSDEAIAFARKVLIDNAFKDPDPKVIVEEFLQGIEMSAFILTNGRAYINLPEAKDYKRLLDNDEGPNTGGMGCVSPVSFYNAELKAKVEERIIHRTIQGLRTEAIDYNGFIFFGLMICDGEPYVIEYNSRMGDPETQAIMLRIEDDIVPHLIWSSAPGDKPERELTIAPHAVVGVVKVSEGYPGKYETGKTIEGAKLLLSSTPPQAFIAGAQVDADGEFTTSGGRVAIAMGIGTDLSTAIDAAYVAVDTLEFDSSFYRRDIGQDLM